MGHMGSRRRATESVEKSRRRVGIVKLVVSAAIVLLGLWLLQRLLMPKYVSDVVEGALIAEYYSEEKDHDVIFIGDCEVYENFSPAVLWRDYGINSYIRGSAQQLIWQSYYLLEDTLRYETPKVVVFNVLAMQYNEPQKEAYNRMTLEGMKWSASKVKSIYASMTSRENFEDYLFPILRYHSRWSELNAGDLENMFASPKVSHNGYYMRVDVKAAENIPEPRPLGDYQFGSNAYLYLDKMADLCEKKGIQLVLIKAPSLYPHWYDQWETQMEEYAEAHGLLYLNFLECLDEIGLDFQTDTYDAGLHLNLAGAEKLSTYFGQILMNETAVTDRRGEAGLEERWQEKLLAYEEEKRQQLIQYGIKE